MSRFSRACHFARNRYRRSGWVIIVIALIAVDAFRASSIVAQDGGSDGRAELILSNLPPRGSKAYNDLLGLAGELANGQQLGFSESEIWSMPQSRIESVIRRGELLGVKTTRLGADWNSILRSASAPLAMSGAQEKILNAMEGLKETVAVSMMASPEAAVVEYALMKDHDAHSAIGVRPAALISRIIIPLNDKENIVVRRTSVDIWPKMHGCTWRGEIEGTGEPVIIMWWKGGRISGMFTYHGHMYSLKNMGGELRAVVETDPGKLPPDHGSMHAVGAGQHPTAQLQDDPLVARGEAAVMRARGRSDLKDRRDALPGLATPKVETRAAPTQLKIAPLSPTKRRAMAAKKITIDLMVLYTSKVASKYIDVHTDLIALSVEQANQSFVNSGLGNIKLRLVHEQLVDYDESDGEQFNHLYRMVDGEGAFARVRALRDERRADIVALIVDDASGCGLATRVAAEAEEAYVVVHHACAALTYSIAHEVGHIIGARHDRALDQNVWPLPYGHGYVNGTKWRDIMSYKESCGGCPRLPVWSNPTVNIKGEPAGSVDADNARVILERAERVSRFR
jgi:hypothetical protein